MNNDINANIESILTWYRTVAIVGATSDPERYGNIAASFLKKHSYHIIPVTPKFRNILNEPVYPDLGLYMSRSRSWTSSAALRKSHTY